MSKNQIQNKKLLIMIIYIIIFLSIFMAYVHKGSNDKNNINKYNLEISSHYNEIVRTNKKANIYIKENEEYKIVGVIGDNVELELKENTNIESPYFNIKSFDHEYYIYYQDVEKINILQKKDDRYKIYIVFNINVITKNKTNFYDREGNLIYSFNKGFSLPVIIKEEDMYGVEFNDRLLFIKEDECEVIDNYNTDRQNSSGVGVLNYHFFYDDSELTNDCREDICVSKSQFTRELDYLDKNNIITIKSNELEDYIDGKIQLPKSVYITIDDGGRNELALEILTERKKYATVFLITDWYDPNTYYKSEYIELHSHGDNIHDQYRCNIGRQGGAILCEDRETLLADLKLSRQKLNNSKVFAYPFYEYNDYSISVLKEAGFTMAFKGESRYSDNLVKVGMDKYKLPRFIMVNYTTIDGLGKYLSQIT